MKDIILKLNGLSKQYPGVLALRECGFDLRPGEVHALVGENGAGKSTLIKIATGVIQPTSGSIQYCSEPVVWGGPREAIQQGIAAVYQDPSVFPDLSVAENIFMNHQPHSPLSRRIRWREMHERTQALLTRLNVRLDPRRKLGHLTAAERQLVEIAKALSVNAKVLFMDEPTSTLSGTESENMFEIVRQLRREGTAIVFISHRLDDIFSIADRVTALRDGTHVDTRDIDDVDHDSLVQMMVGRELKNLFPKIKVARGDDVLRVDSFSRRDEFQNVSLSVHKGEILGLYGLVGAGRTELAKSLFGMTRPDSGQLYLDGKPLTIAHPRDAISAGMAYLPEDRDEEGIILDMDVCENITLPILAACCRPLGWLNRGKEREIASEFSESLAVKSAGLEQKVGGLSGGNKQKVSLAKWLASGCRVLILDEPTKGIDVAAKAAVHQLVSELAEKGHAIIMISSDLPEIMGMADRVVVMHEGVVKAEFPRENMSEEQILAEALSE
ncbi:MAG: sugar ABC transporter ATP-binding protein [Verrucomicrobia bacterium]|nr:sugar ABC transporter ATP-binding protein [Verrucomicrobiota bacterium]MBT7698988.1 sugar ABC transporter ATP-binding protein [Verrucomicrobiota bacterium]